MRILALESTAVAGSAALLDDGKLLGEFFCNTKLTHSQTLMPMVENLFACTQTKLEDVDLFAVTAEGITVVDFKTDYVTEETLPAKADYYRPQLAAYSAALERIMEKPVVRRVLWFFRTGQAVEV